MSPPIWVRRLFEALKAKDVVEKLRLDTDRIYVTYKNGMKRNYCFLEPKKRYRYIRPIDREKGVISRDIPIHDQFHDRDSNKYPLVKKSDLKNSTYMDKEILIHKLLLRVTGYTDPVYTDTETYNELKRIDDVSMIKVSDHVHAYHRRKAGRQIFEKYVNFQDIVENKYDKSFRRTMDDKRIRYLVISKMANSATQDITINNIIGKTYKYGGPKWVSPAVYKGIFNLLEDSENRTIHDMFPNVGEKAVACALQGHKYYPLRHEDRFGNEFYNAIGLGLSRSKDVLIAIRRFRKADIREIAEVSGEYKNSIVFVNNYQYDEAKKLFKPHRIIKVLTRIASKHTDYIFYCS